MLLFFERERVMNRQYIFFLLTIFLCQTDFYVSSIAGMETINIESFEKLYTDSIKNFQKMSYELEVITKLQMGGDVVVANNIEESGRIDIEKQLYFCREIISTTDQSNRDNNLQLYKKVIEYLDKKDNVSLYAELENDQINYLSSKLNINPNWIDRLRFQFVAFLLGYVNLTDKNVFFLD